ncbi:MAG: response regulator [Luteolibacter sp.]
MRILFVDDEEKSRKYFSMIFGRSWDVVIAADGAEGLERVLGDEERQIGVIVTDQIMPNLTGIEMLERVRPLRPDIVKVLSTAYADSDLATAAAGSGVIDYSVEKPWNIDHVREVLEQAAAAHHRLRP